MGKRKWLAVGLMLFVCSRAGAEPISYGTLDFARMSPDQSRYFWRQLSLLAFEEGALSFCGQADDFERQAKLNIAPCVTEEALSKADSVFKIRMKSTIASLQKGKQVCTSRESVPVRGWLGVTTKLGPADGHGVVVVAVNEGMPADAAGVKAGDVIRTVNGQSVTSSNDLRAKVGVLGPNAAAHLGLVRDGAEKELDVKLGAIQYAADGNVVVDMPPLLQGAKQHLHAVLTQISNMCQQCKTSIWAAFCR